ncbi:hypothetical protein E4Z61_10480 [Citrobacter tructae]|uniref:Uncharacterized protein n=1 Tax=Citrobacter tructae TaxID=2562449 RepID=A0ABX5T2R5_9ENTR|nr:hypothetical protein E4Z61_10480 [Citrobacter tructae]
MFFGFVARLSNLITFCLQLKGKLFYYGVFLFFPATYIVRGILAVNFDLFHNKLEGFNVFYGFKFFN